MLGRPRVMFDLGNLFAEPALTAPALPVWLDRPLDLFPHMGQVLNLQQLAHLSDAASGWLRQAGIGPGCRVAVLKRNNFDICLLAVAIARTGAVPVLLSPELDVSQARALVERMRTPHVVTDAATRERGPLAFDDLERLASSIATVTGSGVEVQRLRPQGDAPPHGLGPAIVLVTHTSGTTGVPKTVGYSASSLATHVGIQRTIASLLRVGGTGAACMSFAHGRMYSALAVAIDRRMPMVLLTDPGPDHVLEVFARHRPEFVETYPNVFVQWEGLADEPAAPLANVQYYLNTFDAPHPRTIKRMLQASHRRLPVYMQAYGNSESGPLTVRGYVRETVDRAESRCVGHPVPGFTRVRIKPRPGSGRGAGDIEVRSRGVAETYIGLPGQTAPTPAAWWSTGDLGFISKYGCLHLQDRVVDESAGLDSTLQVEDALLSRLPALREAIVLAAEGGPPRPILCTWNGRPVPEPDWRRAIAGLPPLASPLHCGWDAIPRTSTWKVKRLELRRRLAAGEWPAP